MRTVGSHTGHNVYAVVGGGQSTKSPTGSDQWG
jgi:hypothetical protein